MLLQASASPITTVLLQLLAAFLILVIVQLSALLVTPVLDQVSVSLLTPVLLRRNFSAASPSGDCEAGWGSQKISRPVILFSLSGIQPHCVFLATL